MCRQSLCVLVSRSKSKAQPRNESRSRRREATAHSHSVCARMISICGIKSAEQIPGIVLVDMV